MTRDLSVDFCGVRFLNPVLLSSSPVSNTGAVLDMSKGALVVSPNPSEIASKV